MPFHKALPVHLITGLLGSGKTTTLKQLIRQKPQDEMWGFIINEFGEVDIDAATLSLDNTNNPILSVAGGCVCCSAQAGLSQAINQLLSQQSKHTPLSRIWIEPTGLGHPAKIIDTIHRQTFIQPLSLQQIMCVITPKQLTKSRWQKSDVMRDLVTLSDIILLNKIDQSQAKDISSARQLLEALYPRKNAIIETQQGQITLALLLQDRVAPEFTVLSTQEDKNLKTTIGENEHTQQMIQVAKAFDSNLPDVIQSSLQINPSTNKLNSIGWIFQNNVQFNRNKLTQFFEMYCPVLSRAKGILKTGNEWQLINWISDDGETQLTFEDIAWRLDSRLECIFSDNHSEVYDDLKSDKVIEIQLLNCISKI